MLTGIRTQVTIVFIAFLLVIGVGLLIFWITRGDEPETGITAMAQLMTPAGESMGSVRFTQGESSVLIEAEAKGLEPGGHSFAIHSVGACTPDFSAAGGHFDPQENQGQGFVHSNWNRRDSPVGAHGGDLPNLYAASDGTARADFITTGVTLQSGQRHSLFDSDGSAILIHEKPVVYEEGEGDTGERVACGVIERS